MAIHVTCPRCKKPLTAPNDKAGSYANCPACHGRFWIPQDGPADSVVVAAVVPAVAQPAAGHSAAGHSAAGHSAAAQTAAQPAAVQPQIAAHPVPVTPPKATPPNRNPQPGASAGQAVAPSGPAVPPGVQPLQRGPSQAHPAAAQPSQTQAPQTQGGAAPARTATFRVAPGAPSAAVPAAATVPSSIPAPTPQMIPAAGAGSQTAAAQAGSQQPGSTQPGGMPPPPPGHKTARFISAEAAQSTLKLAADGKLPELHLEESKAQEKKVEGQSSMSPVLLFGLLATSLTLSIAMIVMSGQSGGATNASAQATARQLIAEEYFDAGNLDRNQPIEPYQELLREASRQASAGNWKAERKLYRQVLDMLRAERPATQRGLTGSRARDKILEENLKVLLSGR